MIDVPLVPEFVSENPFLETKNFAHTHLHTALKFLSSHIYIYMYIRDASKKLGPFARKSRALSKL